MPDFAEHVAWLEGAVTQMTEALGQARPDAPVPACPGWAVTDLAEHIVAVHRWASAALLTTHKQRDPPVRRTAGSLADWYASTAQVLLRAVRVRDPDEECWNFAPVPQVAGFWPRRQAHETTVHAVDVIQAAGGAPAIDRRLAADGVDEVFTVFIPRLLQRGYPLAVVAPITVATTDTGDIWTLTPVADGPPSVVRERADNVAEVSGPAVDLYLTLWKRLRSEGLAVTGDAAVAKAFLEGRTTP